MIYAILAIAAAFAVSRVILIAHATHEPITFMACYKDAAHLFTGGLIGAFFADRKRQWLIWTAVALSVLELLCFMAGKVNAAEQRYVVPLTDYGTIQAVASLLNGDSLSRGMDGMDVLKLLKSADVEFLARMRPAWRADGDTLKHAKGFYETRVFLWRQYGPLAALDYQVRFYGDRGAKTHVHSRLDMDVRQFHFSTGDRLVFMLANIPIIHRFVNRLATSGVLAAERMIVTGFANREQERRDRDRAARRAIK